MQAVEKEFNFREEMAAAMNLLAADPRVIFLGQAVAYPGTSMSGTLRDVPSDRLIEMPVAEEMQLGMSIGLSLTGHIPVSIFPRWNFLILAANQLVNHLDKLPLMSGYRPKVIVRVGIGSEKPLYPGHQHVGDFSDAFWSMFKTVEIDQISTAAAVVPAYKRALERKGSTVLVERSEMYN